MTVYIKDLFNLPDRVRRGDFVLKLAEGISRPEKTVGSYVVTPQLADSFDRALDLIKAGVQENTSKACYLHGSFGSGKSHFMAILNLLLQGNPKARSIPDLSAVIAKHNSWTEERKFFLIPYHMIGKESMEQAILGGYADTVKTLYPKTPVPGLYRSEELFKDAAGIRQSLGDEKFFDKLNEGNISENDDWGLLSQGWTKETYDAAVQSDPRSDERVRLVSALVEHFFSSIRGTNEFVDLDEGLSIISKHAQSIGYDAVVLFLDELILWLASRSADVQFVNREGPKVSKLVEAQTAERPIPLISFVARQRDLKELIGENVTGAEYLSFSDTLDWWEARFAKIKLEDKNLPAIAEKRVLKPKSETARRQIDAAFEETGRIREDIMAVLLTSKSDREMFRKIYPFSPAFMDTLVAMSFLLQRERTSLKVMLQILIEQKDTFMLGEIIPVGDLFDAISEGDEAVSDDIRKNFVNARKLYEEKLRPILERDHGLSLDDMKNRPSGDQATKNLKNDDRVLKTLLLAALAPNVEALRGITASRLAALNHGTIKSPIPGHESQIVLTKCRKWAAEVGQIKIGDEPTNPTISIELSGVDTESIIDQALRFDNSGNRIREIKKLIFDSFKIDDQGGLFLPHPFCWRGTQRTCEIKFENVRKQALDNLKNDNPNWQVIIDYPFDEEPGYGPKDDLAKLNQFREESPEGSLTFIIIPSFLNHRALKSLGRLVIINNILKGENFKAYTGHLSPSDTQVAKTLLKNQQSQLQQQMLQYLQNVYGISKSDPDALDSESDLEPAEHFQSLVNGFDLRPPIGADLAQAFTHLLGQALEFQFPAHPQFDENIKLAPSVVGKVFSEIERAAQAPDGRIIAEKSLRKDLRMIANPLNIGTMEETPFIIHHHWKNHFLKMQADSQEKLSVRVLRKWIDEPKSMGLPKTLENLIILTFAAQTNRVFFHDNHNVEPAIDGLMDDFELKEINLPSEKDWGNAVKRAGLILGITQSPLLNAKNVAKFSENVKAMLSEYKEKCKNLHQSLDQLWTTRRDLNRLAPRLITAGHAQAFVADILLTEGLKLVECLSQWKHQADSMPNDAALGISIKKSKEVIDAIAHVRWNIIEKAEKLEGNQKEDAGRLAEELKSALEADELVIALAPKMRSLENQAWKLIQTALDEKEKEDHRAQEKKVSINLNSFEKIDTEDEPKQAQQQEDAAGQSKTLRQGEKDLTCDEFKTIYREIIKILDREKNVRINLKWKIH